MLGYYSTTTRRKTSYNFHQKVLHATLVFIDKYEKFEKGLWSSIYFHGSIWALLHKPTNVMHVKDFSSRRNNFLDDANYFCKVLST